ncbi:MAG: methyl-accepting chemotaxis protein [Pseudomonadota bacterium]
MMETFNLDQLRQYGMRAVAVASVALALATVIGELWFGAGGIVSILLALALPAYPVMLAWQRRIGGGDRVVATVTLVAQPALLLFVFKGALWQIDLHMLFFASLAIAAMLCDWRAIIAGAGVVAVHHLLLGMLVPEWVFLGGGGIGRILMHAVILIAETGALVAMIKQIVDLLSALDRNESERRAAAEATEAERAARAAELEAIVCSVSESLHRIADGDLTREIEQAFPPAYAALKENFNRTLTSLRTLIGSVAGSADVIAGGARQIASASENLARRTEGNAASLEKTSAAIGLMNERLRTLAERADQTATGATKAMDTVQSGRSTADEAVQAMGRVSESAKGIDDVIEGLDKIAFQTRVLAMNAAVEAGRAGEAGRGFAVVADLVSALAMRAEEESKRAREQLTVTQQDIEGAVQSVQRVDTVLNGISTEVASVSRQIDEMATENQAQAEAIVQIRSAIGTMDNATQQNAAMVEETSAAAQNLMAEVESLQRQTDSFRVEQAQGRPARAAHTSGQTVH